MIGQDSRILRAKFDITTSGDTALIAATTGKTIVVYGILMFINTTINWYLKDTDATAVLGASTCPITQIYGANLFNEYGLFTVAKGKGLTMNVDVTANVTSYILYGLE